MVKFAPVAVGQKRLKTGIFNVFFLKNEAVEKDSDLNVSCEPKESWSIRSLSIKQSTLPSTKLGMQWFSILESPSGYNSLSFLCKCIPV